MTGVEPACNRFAICSLAFRVTRTYLVPMLGLEPRELFLLREVTLPICPHGHWWAERELNSHSIDYESNALPLSYQPNTGAAYRNRTHIRGVEDQCIIHYTNAAKLGASSRNRTSMPFRARDFKSLVSTYFTILAIWRRVWESNPLAHF